MTISNCGHDENNGYSGGKAGDQTGTEWYLRSWYNGKWIAMFRHPDAKVRSLISQLAIEAAKNDNIGYDQSERTTFWTQLQKAGYYPSRITTKCEADCSSGVAAIVKAVGYLTGNTSLQNVSKDMYTGNESSCLVKAGFTKYTDSKYLTSESYLMAGDILLSSGHTVIEVTTGANASAPSTPSSNLAVDGYWGSNTTFKLQKVLGTTQDGIISGQDKRDFDAVNRGGLELTTWRIGNGGSQCIKALQKKIGATADGYFGTNSVKALQAYLGTISDGIVSGPSDMVKAMQKRLNDGKL